MSGPTVVGAADVLRAFATLRPEDAEARAAILDLLGFHPVVTGEQEFGDLELEPRHASMAALLRSFAAPPPAARRAKAELPGARRPRGKRRMRLRRLDAGRVKSGFGNWLEDVVPLAQPTAESPVDPESVPPIFRPDWYRSLLLSLVETRSAGEEIDVDLLVRQLSELRVPTAVPRLARREAARRVQLLVDTSGNMVVYAIDQARLEQRLKALIGRDAVEVLSFAGSPLRGVFSDRRRGRQPYPLPEEGTVVVALTCVSLVPTVLDSHADRSEWEELGRLVAQRGAQLVLVAPMGEARLSSVRSRRLAVVEWDRRTSACHVEIERARVR